MTHDSTRRQLFAIGRSRPWNAPEREVLSESAYLGRRELVRRLGLASAGLVSGALVGCPGPGQAQPAPRARSPYPARRNATYRVSRALTPETVAGTYNNFYEFSTNKEDVAPLSRSFTTRPWQVEVAGLVARPGTFDLDDLERTMPLEERVYRFRCVEAWSMTVPWTGFPLSALLERVEPRSEARYVRFVTASRPAEMPGLRNADWYPWPYHEGLRLDEARNELTLLATGIYGHALPPQHGAPVRLVVPWKYGFKSIKSIVRIELTAEEPPTFWHTLQPREYGFLANVDPEVPHPRWSQATERTIDTGARLPTRRYNGYERYVAGLYRG
ncbi:MAG: protein-methionine-sulfoxide reductase catalytic subunit MsrP [Myxococcota bacterium]